MKVRSDNRGAPDSSIIAKESSQIGELKVVHPSNKAKEHIGIAKESSQIGELKDVFVVLVLSRSKIIAKESSQIGELKGINELAKRIIDGQIIDRKREFSDRRIESEYGS